MSPVGPGSFVIGGENLTAEVIAFWQKFAPDTVLINEYGPTETVVGCCVYRVPPGAHTAGVIPIGATDREHPTLHPRRATGSRSPSARPASSTSAARGSPAATSTAPS